MSGLRTTSYKFNNSYLELGEAFYQKIKPSPVKDPELIKFNYKLAEELGLDSLSESDQEGCFSGNKILEGSEPIAQAYAGHQFGHFVPSLGDGRAILLGELIDKQGRRKDIQLKGSGQTQFSRRGDGRAWLGPVIREYLVSEAMHRLGIATTRSLAAVSTGETIRRERELPGAILTRVASSHIRIGTFEYFAARQDQQALKRLADYCISRHYPEIEEGKCKYLNFFRAVCARQAKLITSWISIGFIHGVMNTDNCSISGETIDYGPCGFMDFFDQNKVFSSIDHHGRYSYSNQANICLWNLSCLANTLIDLISGDAQEAVEQCNKVLQETKLSLESQVQNSFANKLGFETYSDLSSSLCTEFLDLMHKYRSDFTLSFRFAADLLVSDQREQQWLDLFDQEGHIEVKAWLDCWRQAMDKQGLNREQIFDNMNKINPAYIPRNHLVEELIVQLEEQGVSSLLDELEQCLAEPYLEQERYARFMTTSVDKNQNYVTYCGT